MKLSQRLRYALYLGLTYPLALLPTRVLHGLASGLAWLLGPVAGYRRRVVRGNLLDSFPEKSPEELRRIERAFYLTLADNIVETVKLLHISRAELQQRVTVTNPEVVDAIAAQGRPIVLYLAHYANWEWMTAMLYSYSPDIYSCHIYKRLHDPAADRLMHRVRSRVPSQGLEIMQAVRQLLAIAREHPRMMCGFISDHRFNSAERQRTTPFLNHDTPYYVGGEAIGRKIGAAYLYLDVEKTGRGRYRLTFVPIDPAAIDGPDPVTRQYYSLLERTIRRAPQHWLWSHKRWPHAKPLTPRTSTTP